MLSFGSIKDTVMEATRKAVAAIGMGGNDDENDTSQLAGQPANSQPARQSANFQGSRTTTGGSKHKKRGGKSKKHHGKSRKHRGKSKKQHKKKRKTKSRR